VLRAVSAEQAKYLMMRTMMIIKIIKKEPG
jgi:hypothetical protein